MVTDVFNRYPAAGILRTGDIVQYAKVVYNSQPVVMGSDLVVMGMNHKVNVNLNSRQLVSILIIIQPKLTCGN